jgi:peptide/nickel transport system permease protein
LGNEAKISSSPIAQSLLMLTYFLRRLVLVVFVVWGVTIATFLLSQVVPGDPALAALGDHASDERILQWKQQKGLDQPIVVQYGIYLGNLLRGDLGQSLRTNRPIAQDLREFFPGTLELSLTALLVAVLLGIPAGVVAALYQNKAPDVLVRVLALLAGATPIYWIAILLLEFLHNKLGLLPGPGRLDAFLLAPPRISGFVGLDALLARDWEVFADALRRLILPSLVLGAYSAALLARMTRAAMLETLSQDYVRTAKAKGLAGLGVVFKHAGRNATLPILTIIGSVLGGLLSGAVLTETIFSWPGIGRYTTDAAISLDFPAVMGVTLLVGVLYALINLAIDLLYAAFDPRITYG